MSYREHFPVVQSCTYLASHSLGAVPSSARAALEEYYDTWSRLGILAWEGPWWEALTGFCGRIEGLMGAPSGSVVPMLNVTQGMAAVASCFDYRERPRVVLADLEFTTSFPFWKGQEGLGAEVVLVASPDGVRVPLERYVEALDGRTCLLLASHAFFRSGALQDLQALGRLCRECGAYLMVDVYQSLGAVPLSLEGVDFLVGGCHKWLCGGPGAGFLYVRPELAQTLEPRFTGWFGLEKPFAYEPGAAVARHPGVFRFLNGTPNVPAFYAAREGLAWIERIGVPAIRSKSLEQTSWLMEQALSRGMTVRTPQGSERNGMVCLDFAGAREAQAYLQSQGVVVDWRPDCGMRVSPHFYNERQDLERFLDTLDAWRKK